MGFNKLSKLPGLVVALCAIALLVVLGAWQQDSYTSEPVPVPPGCEAHFETYRALAHRYLEPYAATGITTDMLASPPKDRLVYIRNGTLYHHKNATAQFRVYSFYLARAAPLSRDVIFPITSFDPPEVTDAGGKVVFGYCRRKGFHDLPLAYNDVEWPTAAWLASHPWRNRTGLPVLWRGRLNHGSRDTAVNASRTDRAVAALLDARCTPAPWRNDTPHCTRHAFLPTERQVGQHRYLAVIDGNCGSVRLTSFLRAGAVAVRWPSDDALWYEPLLEKGKTHLQLTWDDERNLTDALDRLVARPLREQGPDAFVGVSDAARAMETLIGVHSTTCYTAVLLNSYAAMLRFPIAEEPLPPDFVAFRSTAK